VSASVTGHRPGSAWFGHNNGSGQRAGACLTFLVNVLWRLPGRGWVRYVRHHPGHSEISHQVNGRCPFGLEDV